MIFYRNMFFCFLFVCSSIKATAQITMLRAAANDMKKGKYEEALAKVIKFEKNKEYTAASQYLKSICYLKIFKTLEDLDSAYLYLKNAANMLALEQDQKKKQVWCKKLNFCESQLQGQRKELEVVIYNSYCLSRDINMIYDFLDLYPESHLFTRAVSVKDSICRLKDCSSEAQFRGNWQSYIRIAIENNIDDLVDDGVSGACEVMFIVNKDGQVTNVVAMTMKGTMLAKVAVDAIKQGPKWRAARNSNGSPVASRKVQKVSFLMPDE